MKIFKLITFIIFSILAFNCSEQNSNIKEKLINSQNLNSNSNKAGDYDNLISEIKNLPQDSLKQKASKEFFEKFIQAYSIAEKTEYKLLEYDNTSIVGEIEDGEVGETFQSTLYIVDFNNDKFLDIIMTIEGQGTLKTQSFKLVLKNDNNNFFTKVDFYAEYFKDKMSPIYFEDELFPILEGDVLINLRDDFFYDTEGNQVEMWQSDLIEKELTINYKYKIKNDSLNIISIISNE